jgi:hypothetical protein
MEKNNIELVGGPPIFSIGTAGMAKHSKLLRLIISSVGYAEFIH